MSYEAVPPPYSFGAASKPPVRVWDVVVTVVLLVLLGALTALTSFFGLFLGMASDACGGAVACRGEFIGLGVLFAVAAPWVVLVAAAVVAVLLLVKRRVAFWVPLVASVLVIASWFIGLAIASAGLPT